MLVRPTGPAVPPEGGAPSLAIRRGIFAALVAATIAGILWLAIDAVPPRGPGAIVCLILFAAILPWPVIGLWNAIIGFLIMRFARNPVAAVNPVAGRVHADEPITASTAILMCIRNENPDNVVRNLEPLLAGLVHANVPSMFAVYLLSDTDNPGIIAAEESRFNTLRAKWNESVRISYRRRDANIAFKAGNIRDFCDHWGARHDFVITLDADSFMPARTILYLVRIMQAAPTLGILQTLTIGLPSASAFARMFQFGMRLGMRSFTLGSAWWQGDCGPYWGHNAIVRLPPFIEHCRLPELPLPGPLGGHILSHDQIEAALMRRAGYEVRVLPQDGISWEENPPTLIEFIRRDLRWCHGNMQYWQLLGLPGLKPVSRFQIMFAILMYLGSPAWMALVAIGAITIALSGAPDGPAAPVKLSAAIALFAIMLPIIYAPKIASAIDVLLRASVRWSYGGATKFLGNVVSELLFSLLLSSIMSFAHSVFLFRLFVLRRGGTWSSQTRESHSVSWGLAWACLWPQTAAGLTVIGVVAATAPDMLGYALMAVGGLALAVPFAVATASPSIGALFARIGIGRIPEETGSPSTSRMLSLPAIEDSAPAAPNNLGHRISDGIRTVRGVVRSLWIYYADRRHRPAIERLYRRFVRPGDLVFDIGAHVGERAGAFRRLDARVVAVEPQPALVKTLRLLYGRDPKVMIEGLALGSDLGTIELRLNLDNPTVSTVSPDFVAAAADAAGWEGQSWTKRLRVPLSTLDALIARHGMPAFIKIDVEGFEAEVLRGLTQPVAALSFEFTTIQRGVALAAIDRCVTLGLHNFHAVPSESQTFVHDDWQPAEKIRQWLVDLPHNANCGEIYAVRR